MMVAIDQQDLRKSVSAMARLCKVIVIQPTKAGDLGLVGKIGDLTVSTRVLALSSGARAFPPLAIEAKMLSRAISALIRDRRHICAVEVAGNALNLISESAADRLRVSSPLHGNRTEAITVPPMDIAGDTCRYHAGLLHATVEAARAVGLSTWLLLDGQFGMFVSADTDKLLVCYYAAAVKGIGHAVSMADAEAIAKAARKLRLSRICFFGLKDDYVCASLAGGIAIYAKAVPHQLSYRSFGKLMASRTRPSTEGVIIEEYRLSNMLRWSKKDEVRVSVDDEGLVVDDMPLYCKSTGATKSFKIQTKPVLALLDVLGPSDLHIRIDSEGRRIYIHHMSSQVEYIEGELP